LHRLGDIILLKLDQYLQNPPYIRFDHHYISNADIIIPFRGKFTGIVCVFFQFSPKERGGKSREGRGGIFSGNITDLGESQVNLDANDSIVSYS